MTTIRPIVIDDTDPRVAYSGQWFQDNGSQDGYGNWGPTYMHTLHGTTTNSSLSFSFNGTSVKILGTNNPTKTGDNFDPGWNCYIDKLQIGSTTPTTERRNNLVLCQSGTLSDGEHQITLNVTTQGHTFWFDSLQFVPRAGDTYDTAVTLVENTDPSIEWSSGWAIMPGTTTANLTEVPGSSARLNFTGTSATWMSWISWGVPHPATTAFYSIDGGDPVTFPLPGLPENATYDLLNQPCFTTPELKPGPHSLLVTYHADDGPHTPLNLDYLYVTNVTLSKNATSTTTTTQTPDPKKKSMVGPIVGGVVGGLVVLGLIGAFLFFFLKKRNQKTPRRMSIVSQHPNTPAVDPFMTHTDNQPIAGYGVSSASGAYYAALPASASTYHLHPPPTEDSQARLPAPYSEAGSDFGAGLYDQGRSDPSSAQRSSNTRMHATNPSLSQSSASNTAGHGSGGSAARRKGQEAHAHARPEPELVHHQDSGIRMQPDRPVVDIPPVYSEG